MRPRALIFILILLLCTIPNAHTQVSQGGKPYTFRHQLSSESIKVKNLPAVDMETLLYEDEFAPEDEPYRFGFGFDVSYSP